MRLISTMSHPVTHQKLFRDQALAAGRERWIGDLQVAQPPGVITAVAIAIGACALLATASAVIQVPERIAAAGVLLPAGRLLAVKAPRAGIVRRLEAENGAKVTRGQRLLEISGQRQTEGSASVHEQHQDSLRLELAQLDELASSERRMAERHREGLGKRIELARQKMQAAEKVLASKDQQALLEVQRSERARELGDKGVLSLERVEAQLSIANQAKSAKHVAEQGVLSLKEQVELLQEQLQQSYDDDERAAARVNQSRESLRRELLAAGSQEHVEVTAPDVGQVHGLMVREGTAIVAGQQLMTLLEPAQELQAFLYISADYAGRVRTGQGLELELHAFPHQLFGTLGARVVSVSRVPVPAERLETPVSIKGPVFEIRARLAGEQKSGELRPRLPAGATFRADLIPGRWALYRWLLRAGRSAS
jgi:membrane fusion protein